MALGPGSIAFVGFNADGNDGFAFVAIDPIAAGTIIRFNDNEWNGSAIGAGGAFNTGEGSLTWTNGGSDLAAGTIVELLNTSSAATQSVNIGSISGGTISLGNSGESIFSFVGTDASTPAVFLAAVTNNNGGFNGATTSGLLSGTGLVAGSTALVLPGTGGADVAAYNPGTGGFSFGSTTAAASAFNTAANWVAQDASGDQDADNTAPDAPFLTDAQSLIAGVTFTIGALPSLSISDPTVTEGDSGGTILTYTVTASAAAPAGGITFTANTADGSATVGSDYIALVDVTGTIAAGATSTTISVTVNGDTTVEPNETVLVNLSNAANATIAKARGSGTITNDDAVPLPTLSISDATVTEGNSGTTILTYTVTASAPAPAGGITFDVATADGTATADSDYIAHALTGQTIAAGSTTYTFSVTVNGDTTVEPNEAVLVNLSNATNATIADAQGVGTITNDDAAAPAATPWINEFHYDNSSTDAGEFIEIAGAAGTDLTGYSLVLYNGGSNATQAAAAVVYDTKPLSGIIANQSNGFGTIGFDYPSNGIQNGAPDAIALVGPDGVIQFLSYEGIVTGSGGPASGLTSTDVGVSEPGDVTGQSLQLVGAGTKYSEFTWLSEQTKTEGQVNTGQTFGAPTPTVSIGNASIAEGDSGTKLLTFTVTRSDTTSDFSVDYSTLNGTATAGSDYVAVTGNTLHFAVGGPATQQISIVINGDTTQEPNETFSVTLGNLVNTAGTTTIGTATGTGTILNDDVTLTAIHTIQGSGATSPIAGQTVTTQGIVTGIASNGFYIQAPDAQADADSNTSEGIFVFTSSAPAASVVVGALVNVSGTVQEFTPSGSPVGTLSVTELSGAITVTQLSTGNPLPDAVILNVPTSDLTAGVAYFESLEAMRVTVTGPQATGPTNSFGEIFAVANNGAGATGLNSRGDLLVSGGAVSFGNTDSTGGDFNPERIQIDPGLGQATPDVNVGAKLNDVTGIVNYSFGNYEVLATTPVTVATASPLVKETGTLTGDNTHLLLASYNAENLAPSNGAAKFNTIASQIINSLHAPDVIAMQEIQDDSGSADDGVTSANQTLTMLVNAINAAAPAGVHYSFIDNPFIGNDTNGGAPGGNIRTAYLYRDDRVNFVAGSLKTIAADGSAIDDHGSAAANAAANSDQQTNVDNPFFASRAPLVATFTFNGESVTVIDGHFTSKGGSAPLLGSDQPAFDAGEVTRAAQAQAVNTYIDSLQATNANVHVVVAGDLNEFQFEEPINVLKGTATVSNYDVPGADPITATGTYTPGGTAILTDLQDSLAAGERFDYVFEGNAETLDHVMVSNNLAANAQFDVVHLNSEFFDQTSDHEPLLALLNLDTTHPTLVSSSATDNETDIPIGASLVLTFNEPVKAGTGNIILRPATGADISIPVGNGQVTFSGNTVTINPTADLRPGVAYDVIIGSGVITDTSGHAFTGIAQDALDFTTSFTIPAGSSAQTFTISDPGTFTLLQGTTRTQTASVGVTANVASGSTTIDIEGTLNDTASGQRAINATLTSGSRITIGAAGKVQSLDADTIRVLAPNAKVDFTNLGQVMAGTTITIVTMGGPNPGTGFALTYNAVLGAAGAPATDYTSGGVITNGAVNNTSALIQSNSGDAIRLGSHTTLINYGTIKGNGPVNDSNNNNVFNSNPNDDVTPYDTSRGVRFNQSGGTAGKIENYGTIEGAQHAVDVGQTNITNLVINNYATGKIIGHNGSGVGADTAGAAANTVTVENFGKIYGEYGPTFDRAGFTTVDGDADGVDVDGAATIVNHTNAIIAGAGANEVLDSTGAGGFDSNGRTNKSEGISIGGGSITNDGLISGADFGITVNNDSNPANNRSGVLATTIENDSHGEIIGQKGFAIRLENKTGSAAGDNDTITNFGTIIGNGTIPDTNGTVLRQDGNPDPGTVGTLDGVSYTSANAGNVRFISGDGSAIQMGEGDDVLTNHGIITGNTGRAINLEGGIDTLNLYTEGTITGRIDGGAGTDTINLFGSGQGTLGSFINFEAVDLNSGDWTLSSDGFVMLVLAGGPQAVRFAASTVADGHFDARINGFGFDDLIDLKGIGLATHAQLGANNLLTISGGSVTPVTLQLDPSQNFSGDVFKLVSDNAGGTIVTVAADVAPIAQNGSASGAEDHVISGQVSASDPDGLPSPLTISLVSGPQHGQLTLSSSGGYSYSPDADFNGADSFTYEANDGLLGSNVATISLTVTEVNDAPTANPDTTTVAEDHSVVINVLGNDSRGPANEAVQTLSVVSASALHGSVTINSDGTLTYAGNADYNGADTISYTIRDNGTTNGGPDSLQSSSTVAVTVTPVNDAPVFTSSANFSAAENQAVVGTVAAIDPEHDSFVFARAGGADQAFFVIDAHTGALSFVSSPDFEAPADANHDNVYDVLVSATDTFGASSSQTIHVTVTDVAENGRIIIGGSRDDTLTGTAGNDKIDGGNGNDTIHGGDGNDSIVGGNGDDTVIGGRGNDILDGGNGNDILRAGDGNNSFDGGNGDDTMTAGDGNNTFSGGNGNDVITAGNGNNIVTGSNGNETVTLGNGNNTFAGGDGNDRVTVGNGSNSLTGGNGNDLFHVGSGNNTLTGGSGSDNFAFGPGFGKDVVTDFAHGDHIEFDGGVFANFQAVQGAMHQVGADTVISLGTDQTITLQHVIASSLHTSDFLFV
jgi:VCBS repeat-containing protein